MRPFTVLYRPGPAWTKGQPVYAQDLDAHGRYHQALLEAGHLLFAGPFTDSAGGLAVLVASDLVAARELVDADPAVVAGVFTAELHPQHLVFNRYVGKGLTDPGPGI
jgi:uncharacterized protein YciI